MQHCPMLDHIFFQVRPAPPTPPSLHGLCAHTCVGTLPRWEVTIPSNNYKIFKLTSLSLFPS